jgi:hypothetical protein
MMHPTRRGRRGPAEVASAGGRRRPADAVASGGSARRRCARGVAGAARAGAGPGARRAGAERGDRARSGSLGAGWRIQRALARRLFATRRGWPGRAARRHRARLDTRDLDSSSPSLVRASAEQGRRGPLRQPARRVGQAGLGGARLPAVLVAESARGSRLPLGRAERRV